MKFNRNFILFVFGIIIFGGLSVAITYIDNNGIRADSLNSSTSVNATEFYASGNPVSIWLYNQSDGVGGDGNFDYNFTLVDDYYYNQTTNSIYYYNQSDGSYNATYDTFAYNMSDGTGSAVNIFDQDLNTTSNATFNTLIASNFRTNDVGSMNWSVTSSGAGLIFDFPEVGGSNSLIFETTGTFIEIFGNPGAGNDFEMIAFEETQGDDTAINFYEGGAGHNRLWDSGSARFGGGASRLCSNLTSDVDCNTASTGADIVVQDDGWFGGKLFSSDWSNVSINGNQVNNPNTFNSTYDIFAYNQTTAGAGDFNYNHTQVVNNQPNNTWLTTFNSTYDIFAYNMSDGSFNATYDIFAYNQSGSSSPFSYNFTLVDDFYYNFTLIASIWDYNQSDGSYNATYEPFAYNQSDGSFNATYDIFAYNQTVGGDGNFDYNFTLVDDFYYNMTTASIFYYNQSDGSFNSTYDTFAYNQSDGFEANTDTNLSLGGTVHGNLNVTGNVTHGRAETSWNGSCLNTYVGGSLVQSIGCL